MAKSAFVGISDIGTKYIFLIAQLYLRRMREKYTRTILRETWAVIMRLNENKFFPPIFCVPPAGSTFLGFKKLANRRDLNQTIYGFEPKGIGNDEFPHIRVETMASSYIREILKIQPKGPYFLLGRCFGGIVAFEMAQQMHRQGNTVAFLGVVDVLSPPDFYHQVKPSKGTKETALNLVLQQLKWMKLYSETKMKFRTNSKFRDPIERTFYAHQVARKHYVPTVYPGKVTLFRSKNKTQDDINAQLGWFRMSDQSVDCYEISGDHRSILEGPHLEELIRYLNTTSLIWGETLY